MLRYTSKTLHSMKQTLCGEMSELAEGARLEIVYAPKGYLGFESPSLRQTNPASLFQARFDMAPLCGRIAPAEGWQSG